MPVTISGTNGVTFPDSSLQAAAASPYVLKNRIINGAMVVDQRNAGASVTPVDNGFVTDRWRFSLSQASKLTSQQSTTAPTGFGFSLLVTSSSAYTVGASESFLVSQKIEGFNFADLAWGTANAKTITVSFWVRSSLTGTFGGSIANSAANRWYPFSYTISSANTFEYKTITITGDTTGTWVGATNGTGAVLYFSLGAGATVSGTAGAWSGTTFVQPTGAVSVVGTSGATFYITGVQLEQNTSATPFERRLYNQELANCQRYLPAVNSNGTTDTIMTGQSASTTAFYTYFPFLVTPRVPPTGLSVSAASHFTCNPFVGSSATATAVAISTSSYKLARVFFTTNTMTSTTSGAAGDVLFNNASGQLLFTGCEL
jgi:hypothetical protein